MHSKFYSIRFFYFGFCLIFLSSCLTNIDEEEQLDPCDTKSFAVDIKPIIDTNCVVCHGAGGNFPNLTTYTGISNNAFLVKSEVVSKRMPQGAPLSDADIEAISCWVDAGALNN